jgi:hypothetical protein
MEDPAAGKTELHQRKDLTPHLKKVQQDTKETKLQTSHKRRMQKQRPELLNWSKKPPTQTVIKPWRGTLMPTNTKMQEQTERPE